MEVWPSGLANAGGEPKPPQAARGRTASGVNRKRQSTGAGHRGGTARSSEEGLVMGLERRGRAGQGKFGANPEGKEPRCEDRIRSAKDTGLRNLPLRGYAQNQIWCEIV